MRDLHELPKLRDSLSYLYLEHVRVQQKHKAVECIDKEGRTMIPAAALSVLMLGPGTVITHAAVKALADNGCLVVWCGEDGTRCYAQGGGETRKAYHLLKQAELVSDPQKRLQVALHPGDDIQNGLAVPGRHLIVDEAALAGAAPDGDLQLMAMVMHGRIAKVPNITSIQ